jgi:hypothetical protein
MFQSGATEFNQLILWARATGNGKAPAECGAGHGRALTGKVEATPPGLFLGTPLILPRKLALYARPKR